MSDKALIKTLVFQLNIQSDNENLLHDACLEARWVYNETISLAKQDVGWDVISLRLEEEADLVKNTTQRIVAKALEAMENYYENDDCNLPSHTKDGEYPLRANYQEGYNLSLADDGDVEFRISAKPHKHVKGFLRGSDAHLEVLKTALTSDEWKVSTSEALWRDGEPELHVSVTNTEQTVRDKQESRTVIGIDLNEDNVALAALTADGVEDTLVVSFPGIKLERHRYFTMRKRALNAGKESVNIVLEGQEKRYVRDRLHKVSHDVVKWSRQFENPCIIFEDLKALRGKIDYGTQMNRRLHHLPFRAFQLYTSYKAAFVGIPTAWINPKYTSQRCPMCGHTARANRSKKRFKCTACSHQDHADRSASLNIAVKGIVKHQDWNVPALNNLPVVRKVRRRASGAVDAPTVTHDTARGRLADGVVGVFI